MQGHDNALSGVALVEGAAGPAGPGRASRRRAERSSWRGRRAGGQAMRCPVRARERRSRHTSGADPERVGPIVAGSNPRDTLSLHATQDLGDDDLANHRDRVDQRVTESHARVGVGAAVREGEDCGLRLRAAQ